MCIPTYYLHINLLPQGGAGLFGTGLGSGDFEGAKSSPSELEVSFPGKINFREPQF